MGTLADKWLTEEVLDMVQYGPMGLDCRVPLVAWCMSILWSGHAAFLTCCCFDCFF